MKTTLLFLSLFLGASHAMAWTSLSCKNAQEGSFVIEKVANPRNQADALLSNLQGNFHFGGVWLFEKPEGREVKSDHRMIYSTMNGSKLTVVTYRAACGRGDCALPRPLYYAADFETQDGQKIHYNCN